MPGKRHTSRRMPINSKNAGLRNERLVISLLRQHESLSQAQLCQLAGLSSSTASYIVGRLREKKLITEERGDSTKRGAKPVIISLHPLAQLAVGVEIGPSNIYIGLFDFHCNLVESLRAPLGEDHSPETVVHLVEISVRGLLSKHNVAEQSLLGIGATVSGAISADGVVQLSSPMGWKNVPLREKLQERFHTHISVHTTRVRMFAEISLLPTGVARNIVLLNFADGVGASMAEDGQLSRGATNRAGEIGHIIFDPNGPQCGCGHRGCLETFVSGPALAGRINRDLGNGTSSVLRDWIRPDDPPKKVVSQLGRAMAEGDAYALQIREFLADYVSRATAIAINCYDPDMLILAGYVVAQCPDHLIAAVEQRIGSDVFDPSSRKIQVVVARAGEEALIRGIATVVLRDALERI
ncbi:MAG: ROK family transcriptional regulator [Phycisphaerae bacterium]